MPKLYPAAHNKTQTLGVPRSEAQGCTPGLTTGTQTFGVPS
jgi:hypothetical protein